jgi:hypothetical protein
VPDVPDGTPVLVQASVVAPDGEYVASSVLELLVSHPVRACADTPELDPDLALDSLADESTWLLCDPLPCGTADSVGQLGAALPVGWVATSVCDEISIVDACCQVVLVDDPSTGDGTGACAGCLR